MKSFVVLSLCLFSLGALAQGQEDISQIKNSMVAGFDQKINLIQNAKTCVSSASTRDQLKACGRSLRESMKSLKGSMKAERDSMKAQRKSEKSQKKK